MPTTSRPTAKHKRKAMRQMKKIVMESIRQAYDGLA
jgi:hypothetical protein